MIELAQLTSVFTNISNWLETVAELREKREKRFKKALHAIYFAANETRAYVATLKRRKKPNRERECALSHLWSDAAIELRKLDPLLADTCILKSEYWSDPTDWSHNEIDSARISLKEIFDMSRELLQK
ncbi:hypothetical protein KAW18_04100 [candidate division WOR-3 bacterium]|nr:hypothetical protein [candidate division WOR-3 bacterium]MCK4526531.1 hypothetical protein [candidate division WOR-3 bacterium]